MNDLATLGLAVDSSQVVKGAEDLDRLAKASERAEAAAEKVSKSTQKTSESIKDQKDELSKLLNQIDPATRALEKLDAQERKLAQFRRSGQLDTDTFKDYQTKIDAARNSLGAANDALQRTGNTAKQTSAALRGVPAQFTDIVVSLQGGQAPLTVLLQQGGQLKDMFGGIGPAAKALGGYVAGLINPFTVAGAAAAALGVAFYQGSQEASNYSKALILNGNAAGTSAEQLANMANTVSNTVGTTGQAAEVLALLAGNGKIASSSFEEISKASISFSKATGTAIEDVVAQYAKLAKDPTKASVELNEQLNYLTASTYQQIQALQESGDMAGAQAIAFHELSQAQTESSQKITENLGAIESGWNALAKGAKSAWDAMLGVGREDTLEQKLNSSYEDFNNASQNSSSRRYLEARIQRLQREIAERDTQTLYAGQDTAREQAALIGVTNIHKQYLQGLDKEAKKTIELTKLDADRANALRGQGANALQIEKEYAVARQGIIDKYKETNHKTANPLDLTSFNDAQNALKLLVANYDNAEKQLEASQRAGTISSEAYYSQRVDLINKEKTDVTAAYQQEIVALEAIKGKSTTTANQRIQLDQRIADARAQMVKAQQDADSQLAVLATQEQGRLAKQAQAVKTYTDALNEQLAALQEEGARDAAVVSMGKNQQRLYEKLTDLERSYNRKRLDLANQYADKSRNMSQAEYEAKLNALDAYYRSAVQTVQNNEQLIQNAQSNWANGANAAWQDYLANARDVAGQTYNAFSDAFRSMEDALVDFVMGGKASFDDFVKSVIAGILRIQAQKLIIGIGGALGLGGVSGSASASSLLGSLGGGGGGGLSLSNLYSMGTGAYNFITGAGANLYNAFQSGGLSGVWNYGSSAVSGLFGGGAAVGSGTGYGLGQSLVSGGIGNASYAATPGLFSGNMAWGSAGSALAGIGGALYGYQQSGWKGAATGGAGAYAGAAIGSIAGPIGTAIGAALGGFLGGSLFGGKWQTKDMGLSLGVSGGDLDAQQYEYQKKKGGLFGKNKKRTRYSDLDAETEDSLNSIFEATSDTVAGLYKELGIDIGDKVIDSMTIAATQISTKDKSEEEINQAITDWFSGVTDQMTEAVNQAAGNVFGREMNLSGLQTMIGDLVSVNALLDQVGQATYSMNVTSTFWAEQLKNFAGGLDALTASVGTYYQNFFTEAERQQDTLEAVRKEFAALGVTLPETRNGYRQMVEALDMTTDAGRAMFVTLTNLSGDAATAYSILEQQAAAAQQAMTDAANAAAEAAQAAAQAAAEAAAAAKQVLVDSVSSAFTALQRAITAEQKKLTDAYNARVASLNDMVSTANSNISTLTQLSGSLHSALQQLRGASDTSGMAYQSATSQLRKALSGGSLVGADLNDAISAVTGNTSDRYSNWQDFARDQGRSANLLEALEGKTNGQLTTQEKTLATLEKQLAQAQTAYDAEMARLQGQLDLAQAQIDAINGVDNTVLSVVDAVNRLHASIIALSPSGTGGMNAEQLVKSTYKAVLGRDADAAGLNYWKGQLSSGAVSSNDLASAIRGSANQNGELIRNLYQQILGRAPDAAGMSYWQNAVASGSVTDLIAAFKAAAKSAGEIPGFAMGGSFDGGARIVGENGPELEVTGPSRIYSHSETKNMFSSNNADLVAEVRALRQEIANQTNLQSQITRNTAKTARYTQQMNEVGLPAMES